MNTQVHEKLDHLMLKVKSEVSLKYFENNLDQYFNRLKEKISTDLDAKGINNPDEFSKVASPIMIEVETTEEKQTKKIKRMENIFTGAYLSLASITIATSIYFSEIVEQKPFSQKDWIKYTKLKHSTITLQNAQKDANRANKNYELSLEELSYINNYHDELSDLVSAQKENSLRITEYIDKTKKEINKIESIPEYKAGKTKSDVARYTGFGLAIFMTLAGLRKMNKSLKLRNKIENNAYKLRTQIYEQMHQYNNKYHYHNRQSK